jgi:hypothetical protein
MSVDSACCNSRMRVFKVSSTKSLGLVDISGFQSFLFSGS